MTEIAIRDQRRFGWFSLDNEIIDDHGRDIGAYGVAVYCAISRHSRNQVAKLSQRDIATSLGISQDRVRKSLADLANLGLVHVEIPERSGPGLITTITLLNIKPTERHTFSSADELNATRSRNKEVKNKTINSPLSETAFVHSKEKSISQSDFDARDRRLLAVERRRLEMELNNGRWGSLTDREVFEVQMCSRGSLRRASP